MKEMTSRERVLCALNHQQPAWRPAGSEGRRNACRNGSHVHAVPVKERRFGLYCGEARRAVKRIRRAGQ